MGNPSRYDEAHARALEGLAQLAAQAPVKDSPRPAKAPALPAPEFPQTQGGAVHLIKNGLNGGELSPDLGARFDQQRYQMGCHSLLNMIPLPWGGIRKRPGLNYICPCLREDKAASVRLIPFIFSQNESRLLELSSQGGQARADLRVFDADGALLYEKKAFLPVSAKALASLSCCQSADVIFIAHQEIAPGKIMRYADDDWRYAEISWLPSIAAPSLANVDYEGVWPEGEKKRVKQEYACTAIDAETGQESALSSVWKLAGNPPLSDSWYVVVKIKPLPGASEYRVYRKRAGVFGFIGYVSEPTTETDAEGNEHECYIFEDHNIEPDTADTPPKDRNPFETADEHPSLVFLHQQRLGFAASKGHPLTVWLSQSGNYESMAASTPPDADDAIEASLAAPECNSIVWAQPDRSGLLIATQGGIWLLAPAEGAALSPTDLSFQPQNAYGSQEGLMPVRSPEGLIFAQRGGRAVRVCGYSFQDDRYTASDLSILARHIFQERSISSWAWQQEPWSILWICLSDGSLAGLTWLREQEIMAWHRHETEGFIEQACAIPREDGSSAVFFTIIRKNRRGLEMFSGEEDFTSATSLTDGPERTPYKARCVPCLPEAQTDQNSSSFMLLRKINSIKARVRNSKPFALRVISQKHSPSETRAVPARADEQTFAKEAIWHCPIGSGFREDARVELIMDGPDPVAITALLITAEFADMSGGQG